MRMAGASPAAVALALIGWAGSAAAAELAMFETATCPWCLKWHREVGPVYDRTDEGRLLPLRRVDMMRPPPAPLAGIVGVKYSPTFVVLDCRGEAGRIVGYGGEAEFYGELAAIIARMKAAGRPAAEC
jgi:hypothetical protein